MDDAGGIAPYADPVAVMVATAEGLRPPERVDVPEAALRHRLLENPGGGYSGPWTFDLAPYLRGPMAALTDDRYRMVALMGCAQGGKTEIPLNWLLHTVIYDPADVIWCQVDRDMMRDFSVSRVDKMVRLCHAMRSRQLQGQGADNIFSKQFRGMLARFIWPVAGQFTQRPAPRIVLDDYDNMPEDIDGQGDAVTLGEGRQTTFEGREKMFVASTPARGADKGIEALVATGTDETYRVPCPQCGERFALDFDRDLDFAGDGTPEDAEASARVVCPANGCVIEAAQKYAMMKEGVWAGVGQTVTAAGEVAGTARRTDIASFRVDGLMGFSSWGRLARLRREAEIAFETTQDEAKLRAFQNVRAGKNYVNRMEGERPIEPDLLAARRESWPLGTVPPGVKALTAAVDVQGNRFEVLVIGWGESSESWLVDRFAILQLEDGRTRIDPARYAEHWGQILTRVVWKRYPLSDAPDVAMPILTTAIDTGGAAGVSDNAVKFWSLARGGGAPDIAITLVKGGNNPRAPLMPAPTTLDRRADGKARKGGPKLWVPNVHELKNMLDVRLRRIRPGPGCIHFPAGFEAAWFEELTAERKERGLWVRVRPRNETLDLYGYNETARRRLGGERSDMRWVPGWAARPETDGAVEAPPAPGSAADEAGDDPAEAAPAPPPAAPPPDHPHAARPPRAAAGRNKSFARRGL